MPIQSAPTVNGVYRIKSLSTNLYWEYQSDKGTWIKLASLDPSSDRQKWRITSNRDSTWSIQSMHDKCHLVKYRTDRTYHGNGYPLGSNVDSGAWVFIEEMHSNQSYSKIRLFGESSSLDQNKAHGATVNEIHFAPDSKSSPNQRWVIESLEEDNGREYSNGYDNNNGDGEDVYACIQRLLPNEEAHAVVEAAVAEYPNNAIRFQNAPVVHGIVPTAEISADYPIDKQRLGLFIGKMWSPGRTLNILFRGGSVKIHSRIKQYAGIWSQHANIVFNFVKRPPAEIRIGFNKGDGSWSYVGTDALMVPESGITMNLGSLNDYSTDEVYASTILHEFGHALGCVHEHSQPNAKIQWNKRAVYEFHRRVAGWSKDDVDSQIFLHYSDKKVDATAYDTTSIMHYPIDERFTINRFSVGLNSRLSENDIAFIKMMYPATTARAGTANTLAYRCCKHPAQSNKMTIPFDVPSYSPSDILVGLNWLDVGNNADLRVSVDVEEVTNDHMRINIWSWGDTDQYSAGCAWLRVPSDDPDFQFGHFRTDKEMLNLNLKAPLTKISRKITFKRRYDIPPTVVVWLNALDVSNEANYRVSVYATNVKRDGFTLHIDTWADTKLYMAGASWLAYNSSRSDIASGTFSTDGMHSSDKSQPENYETVTFDASFEDSPHVFMALNSLNIDKSANARVRLSSEGVSPAGMTWHIDSWSDTKLYGAGASYIAIANAT